jgi:hypothetical protein
MSQASETVPVVKTGSYNDKHSGHTIRYGVTLGSDGSWQLRKTATDAREQPDFVDAPEQWQREWNAHVERRRKVKSVFKHLLDRLDYPITSCVVCGADHGHVHKVTNRAVVEAAHGLLSDYEDARDHPVYWCDECGVNYKKSGDYNYSSRVVYADVFESDAPQAVISRSFSLSQDRSAKSAVESPEKYQEPVTDFYKSLNEVREYVQASEDVSFDWL